MNEKVLAFIIDGKVTRVMRFDEGTAAVLLSNPEVVDITNVQVTESWNYNPNKGFYVDIDGQELVVPLV
jgi:hypothetical protein